MRTLDHEEGNCIVITVTASGGSFARTDLEAGHSALQVVIFKDVSSVRPLRIPGRLLRHIGQQGSNLHCMRVFATGVFVVGRVSNGYE